ncbi:MULTISPECIES: hypothetical protein [Maribacter]|uniref:hypothetical protein n=1 Tax=Maribacter TaxID=252356 RepID=UPI00234A4BFF|nr:MULTISPECIES: hypothetical protein [Maribacter]
MLRKNKESSYSFALFVYDASPYHIYNLVMQNDGKGKLEEAYVVGFEMLPEDMESFFMDGEDYGGFRSTFRFYSVASFFEDSKFNRVGKTGDCGTGTTGGNYSGDIGYNSPGTVLSHNYDGNNITTSFSYNTVSTTYYYNSTIVSNGTVSTVSTEATSGVVEVATSGPTAPVYTTYVPNGTTQVNVSYEAPNSSGPGATTEPCTSTNTVGPDGTWSGSLCATPSTNQNKSGITAYGDDCVSGSGTFAINTAAKPLHKLYYALNGSFTAGHFNWFTDPDHTERVDIAKEFVWFLIDNGNTEENINFVLTAISALMEGYRIDFENWSIIKGPSCESFDFYNVGTTGVQVPAINGIWDDVTKWGKFPGIGVAASYQTYYFHLPSYINKNLAAERSADALANAFFDMETWFRKQPCGQITTGVLAYKMDEFIKENFNEIGGQATRSAPLGWSGVVRQYIEDWSGMDNCYQNESLLLFFINFPNVLSRNENRP